MDARSLNQSRAEALYAGLLVETPHPSEHEVRKLCAAHPELEAEFVALHGQLAQLTAEQLGEAMPSGGVAMQTPGGPPILGDFRCESLLGQGGMGEVWEAVDLRLERRVALKLLRNYGGMGNAAVQRFRREAQAAGRVQHPGIVAIYQTGEWEGRHYIVQELVPGGRTLRDEIEELRRAGELPAQHAQRVAQRFLKLAQALQAAHAAGIIHRDLKPQNVLLTLEGEPKVADFGLASLESDLALSRSGEFLGTYFYASPEQIEARHSNVNERSDVFSLGATLYENLTLARAFEGDTVREVSRAVVERDPLPPHTLRRRVSPELSLICMKAMEKRAQDRYPSMQALADDLERFLSHRPILARPPSPLRRALKWVQRHPTIATALAVSTASSIALASLLLRSESLRRGLDQANQDLKKSAAQLRVESNTSENVVNFLLGMFEKVDPEISGNRKPLVLDLIEPALIDLQSNRLKDPEVRCRLLQGMAYAIGTLGEHQRAAGILEQVLALREELGQGESIAAGHAVLMLWSFVGGAGDHARAAALIEPWVARIGESEEYDREFAAVLYSDLGDMHLAKGELAPAARAFDRAQEYCQRFALQGSIPLSLARSRATLRLYENDLAAAEAILRDELQRCANDLEHANPRALALVNLLGLVMTEGDRLIEAEELYINLAEKLGESLDNTHPSLLTVQNNLARVWQRMNRFDDAEALYREIIHSRQDRYGEDDLGALPFMNNLGTCLALGGRAEEAEEVHRAAWEARINAFGPNDASTLESQNNLVFALQKIGRNEEALQLQADVVQKTPPDHPDYEGRRAMLLTIRERLNLKE